VIPLRLQSFFAASNRQVRSILAGLGHLLWPRVCCVCRTPISDTYNGICRDCWAELLQCTAGDYCPRCGIDASKYARVNNRCGYCHDKDILFDGIARAGVYKDSLRDMILSLKFRDRTELEANICVLADAALQGCVFKDRIDFFVPVPLHWVRRLRRGYNQAMIITRGLKLPSAVINTDLVRIRHTKRQWYLTPAKRKRNVAGAFAVRKDHKFSGKTVCLIDDITTSRATLNECAKTLKQAGAEQVFALVLAVAMQDT
jgi:ComF family protein